MAGHLLRGTLPAERKLVLLVGIGRWPWPPAAGSGATRFPLNRHLWTSSTILWAGGWSFLLVALFYGVIDIWGVKSWAFPFVVIGANALLAYVFDHVFDRRLSDTLVLELANQCPIPLDELVRSVGEVGLLWLILWYLYRNRIFLRA